MQDAICLLLGVEYIYPWLVLLVAMWHSCMHAQAKESALADKPKDAFEESDDESAISRTESELREVTKVRTAFCPQHYFHVHALMHHALSCRESCIEGLANTWLRI